MPAKERVDTACCEAAVAQMRRRTYGNDSAPEVSTNIPPVEVVDASGGLSLWMRFLATGFDLVDRIHDTISICVHSRRARVEGLYLTCGSKPANALSIVLVRRDIGVGFLEFRCQDSFRIISHLLSHHAFPFVPGIGISPQTFLASGRRWKLEFAFSEQSFRLRYIVRRVLAYHGQC